MFRWLRRRGYLKRPFPAEWEEFVSKHLGFAARYEGEEKARFRDRLKLFVWEKYWIGAADLTVTDEMRVVIAGVAARMGRNLPLNIYDRLTEIIIYPSHYKHPDREHIILGEAHTWGTLVLSWDAVKNGLANPRDGHDTAAHELAHVLDISDGAFDGTPPIAESEAFAAWVRVFSRQFVAFRKQRGPGVMRDYGATNEAEFFAVATETFFEKPEKLREKLPELYAELARYYRVDPAKERRR